MAAVAGNLDADLTAGLSDDELAELRRLLSLLSHNLEDENVHRVAAR
jgi:hypothetical protein